MKLLPMLTVLFVGLRLGGVIAWSWWWVLSPTWMPLAFVIGALALGRLLIAVDDALLKRRDPAAYQRRKLADAFGKMGDVLRPPR